MPRRLAPSLALAALAALAVPAVPAAARDETGSFAVHLGGIRAGTIGYSFAVAGDRYRVRAEGRASGLLRLFYEVAYVTESAGRVAGGRYVPRYYREERVRRDSTERAEILFSSGVPGPKTYDPARPPEDLPLDPAGQGGTADPMTAAFAIMRDTETAALCDVDIPVWDGERRGRITLSGPRAEGADRLCDGVFRRVGGYSEKDMREQAAFPFTIRYAALDPGWWRMTEARAPSSAGSVVMQRQ
jgi:hypothetical protein